MALDDAELFSKIQSGDADAFSTLYDRYHALVYTFAFRSCHDADLANEITQDVFVRLWTTASPYRPELSQFRTWLLTITRRIIYDKLRKQRRDNVILLEMYGNVVGVEDLKAGPAVMNPEMAAVESWFREDVRTAMQSLHIEDRRVIELAYFQQLTLVEISQKLNRPLGTIKTRLHRTLKVLRETMPEWRGGTER
ncbi:RNA polymerase sigma factor [Alicyclobacillus mengziensis]|uniref:Sigma-70 family RNA polymerase sigma factor n=1 Tax=Alicyclobacillus mengziensis TaxID=2931921 RepID=A0A9X7W0H2_9BACL|nr:sigma-70 family RNA polymerase sigma factor [Alicyclobacillus mengziensis]QSO48059.1 sigma-70 family RNA polymerase sigma factor [Alicyclobacillus mengziensis]